MKILISKVGHELDLAEELEAMGFEVLLPVQTRKVRVSRKSNKMIEKEVLVVRRMLFCDIERMSGLRWLQSAWVRDDKWVEVTREEVLIFVGYISTPPPPPKVLIPGAVGEEIVIPDGIFKGQILRITSRKGNKIKGVLIVEGQEMLPIAMEG